MEQEIKVGDVVIPNENFTTRYHINSELNRAHVVAEVFATSNSFKTTEEKFLYLNCFKVEELVSAVIVPTTVTPSTTAVATTVEEEQPKIWVMEVAFPYARDKKTYEYYAFGLFDELAEASHVVLSKEVHTDINDLLNYEELSVARVMNVKPVSQQRFAGKLKYIVDLVDGSAYVERNMKDQRANQLRKDLKERIEIITKQKMLEKMVSESGDEVAAQLLAELKELEG